MANMDARVVFEHNEHVSGIQRVTLVNIWEKEVLVHAEPVVTMLEELLEAPDLMTVKDAWEFMLGDEAGKDTYMANLPFKPSFGFNAIRHVNNRFPELGDVLSSSLVS